MKTIYFRFLTIGIVMTLLVGCNAKELTDEDFKEVKAGMTTEELVDTLGEPQEIVTDTELAFKQKHTDSDNSLDREIGEDGNLFIRFAGGTEEDLEKLRDKTANADEMSYYHYEYGDSYRNVYIVEDQVVWMTFY